MTIVRRSSARQPDAVLGERRVPAKAMAVTACLAAMAGCAQAARSVDNVQLAVAERALEMALRNDDLELAEDLAVSYEARVPGPEAQAFLGRVRFRQGQLLEAEALSRRAATGGAPGGDVGLAMASIASGRMADAAAAAHRLLGIEGLAGYGHRVLAALALTEGRLAAARDSLRAAADADAVGQSTAGGLEDAEAFAAAADAAEPTWNWTGEVARVELRMAADSRVLVPVMVAAAHTELQLDLTASRSSLSTRFAARAGLIPAGSTASAVLATVQIGSLRRQLVFRVTAGGDTAGVLGFDAIVDARWRLSLAPPRLVIGPPSGSVRGTPFDTSTLADTHWVSVRTPRLGLASQLFAMPRIDGRVVAAALDLSGSTVVDQRQAAKSKQPGMEPRPVEVRVGGWRGTIDVAIADLYPRARQGQVAPLVLLGGDFLRGWELHFSPGSQQLALRRLR